MKRGLWFKMMSRMSNERGLAFMSTLIVSAVLGLGALAFITTTSNGAGAINKQIQAAQALYSSEAAASWAMTQLKTDANWTKETSVFKDSVNHPLPCPQLPGIAKEDLPQVSFLFSPTSQPKPNTWGTFTVTAMADKGKPVRRIKLDVSKGNDSVDVNVPLPPQSVPVFNYATCACSKINPSIAKAQHPKHSCNSYKSHEGKYKDHDEDDDDRNEGRHGDIDSEGDIEIDGKDYSNPTVITGNIRCKGNVVLDGSVKVYGDVTAKGGCYLKHGAQVLYRSSDDDKKKGGGSIYAEGGYFDDGDDRNKVAASVNVGKKCGKPKNSHIKGSVDNSYLYSNVNNTKNCPCSDTVDLEKAMTYFKDPSHNANKKLRDRDRDLYGHEDKYLSNDDDFTVSDDSTYTIPPGYYHFKSFKVTNNSHVKLGRNNQDQKKYDSDVVIYLDVDGRNETVKLGKKCGLVKHSIEIDVDSGNHGDDDKYTPNFRLYTNTTGSVDLDADADEHHGTVYAPNAKVHISKKARMKGAVVGDTVDWGDDEDDDEWHDGHWEKGCPTNPHPNTIGNTNEQIVFDEDTNTKQDLPKAGTDYVHSGNPYAVPKIWREVPLN